VDLPGLAAAAAAPAAAAAASSKQQAASSTREMGKNQNSVVVLQIRVKFWWMIPMGVRDHHTKYEPETQRWRPGTGVASAGPPFQNLQFRVKISLIFAQNRPRTC
jgi:hypothetical protein